MHKDNYEQATRLFTEGEEHARAAQADWPWKAFNPAIWALEGAAHLCSASTNAAHNDGHGTDVQSQLPSQIAAALDAARKAERERPKAWYAALQASPRRSKRCVAQRVGGWPKPRSRRAVLRLQEVRRAPLYICRVQRLSELK